MIEVLKEFLLFGVVEVFTILLFQKKIGNINNIKYWHMFVLCPIIILLNIFQFPFMKQISSILIISIYIVIISKEKFIKIIKLVSFSFLYLLCIEMIICSILDLLFSFDFTSIELLEKFIIMIPIRIVEVYGILIIQKWRK